MPTFRITETELRDVCRRLSRRWGYDRDVGWEYNARGYILVSFGSYHQHHYRFDLVDFDNNRKQKLIEGKYNYLLTSVHVKGEESYERKEYSYLYLNYAGGGVWDPVWGYLKIEGERRVRKIELTEDQLSAAYRDVRALFEVMSDVTRVATEIGTANPKGAGATAHEAGLQGIEW